MIKQVQLEQAVMIQLHRNGKWFRMKPVIQVCREQLAALVEGKPLDWISVAIAPNTMLGQKKLAEIRKGMKAGKVEGGMRAARTAGEGKE